MRKKSDQNSSKRLRDEHAEATRNAIIMSARELFSIDGFATTSIDQIAEKARVTKGAVYHHFDNKNSVFRAVYEQLAAELANRVRTRIKTEAEARSKAFTAIDIFLECSREVDMQSILFRDGRVVLGNDSREIDEKYFLGLIQRILDAIVVRKKIRSAEVRIASRLLLAVLIECSEILGTTKEINKTRAIVKDAIERIFLGLTAQ